jgi:hypothetical protein
MRPNQAEHMMKTLLITALTLGMAGFCSAQSTPASVSTSTTTAHGSSAPYTEGPIWVLTMIKTKAGLSDDYLKSISQSVKPVYDEEKKQKIILDYKILDGDASGAQDFNILIMVQYPNMAALDGLRDKMDPIVEKVMGPEDQRRATAVKRLDIREILATKTMREITLK